jgi:undecaprenyl-diphosphatase
LAIAVFVGVSRMLRGSHFLTDVMGGAIIGILSGFVAAAPLRQWRTSLLEGFHYAAIAAAGVLAVLWTLSHRIEDGMTGLLYVTLGVISIAGGLWCRREFWFRGNHSGHNSRQATTSILLMALGVAAMTTSPLVVASVGCICVATWFRSGTHSHGPDEQATKWPFLRESAILGSLCLALLILVTARGILPFQ